jgi:prevent-host-death family protein
MSITTISSREFNQDLGRAKNAARRGPVVITDRGRPAHVLLSIEDYRRLSATNTKIADLLAMPEADEIELELTRSREFPRPVDLS